MMSKNLLPHEILSRQARGFITSAAMFAGVLMVAALSYTFMGTEAFADSEPKRIVLIGATALAAPDLINQALDAGHEVIGVARRPEAAEIKHERFKVVKGDVYDVNSIENALTGDEIVISYIDIELFLGVEVAEEVDLFSRGTANIIQAMNNKGNRRLIVTSSIGVVHIVLDKPSDDAPITVRLHWNRRYKYDDLRRMEEIIKASDLDYIILRSPHQLIEPSRGPLKTVVNGNMFKIIVREDSQSETITTSDLATFILKQLDSDEYVGKTVGVYN